MIRVDAPSFSGELKALQDKYPDHFIDAWIPEDFQMMTDKHLSADDCKKVAAWCYDCVDANTGMNWQTILGALEDLELR
jgi:hypothetical protein